MNLDLHGIQIQLSSSAPVIRDQWQQLLAGWLTGAAPAQVKFCLELQEALPRLPAEAPVFVDTEDSAQETGILTVYRAGEQSAWLHYLDGALVKVPLHIPPAGSVTAVTGTITPQAINYGRFEDVTFTSLAPALRRHGYFMVHAFAAAKNGRCALIVGPTGSGKTTTGLSLLLAGWQLISNDLVLLQQRGRQIYALPTPGIVNIRPQTIDLLPQLKKLLAGKQPVYGQHNVTGEALVNGRWALPHPVTGIYFPFIERREQSSRHHRNRAVALAHLMAESMDRWDEGTLTSHLHLLQRLARQAAAYEIHLGQDMAQIPALFEV